VLAAIHSHLTLSAAMFEATVTARGEALHV
jgi:hypothetical protein